MTEIFEKNCSGGFDSFEIGVDLAEISRFELDRTRDASFLNRIFSKDEIGYCFSRPDPAQHLAARFAAKEAAVKALSACGAIISDWKKIEIANDRSGRPVLSLPAKTRLSDKVSLSHSAGQAIAFVIVYGRDNKPTL